MTTIIFDEISEYEVKKAVYMLSRVIAQPNSIRLVMEEGVLNLFDFVNEDEENNNEN